MARRVVVTTTVGWGLSSLSTDAELVVSELVTNALLHAPGTDHFELSVVERPRVGGGGRFMIAPVIRELVDGRPGGRGLRIVQALAAAWGHQEEGSGTRSGLNSSCLPRRAPTDADRSVST